MVRSGLHGLVFCLDLSESSDPVESLCPVGIVLSFFLVSVVRSDLYDRVFFGLVQLSLSIL